MSFTTLPEEIRGEFTVNADGSTTTTIRGAARLAGISPSSLSEGVRKMNSKLTQSLISKGLETDRFLEEGINEVALANILEYYALEAGARCTEQAKLVYKAFASIGIRVWLQQQLNYQPSTTSTVPNTNQDISTIEAIERVFSSIYKLPIKTELVESAKLTAIAKTIPHLVHATEVGKQLLSSEMEITEIPVSPTEIGKAIADKIGLAKPINPRQVNEVLIEMGLQTSERITNGKGKSKLQYQLTEFGEKYGQLQMETAKGNSKTLYIIRWFKSVIPVIIEKFKQ